MALVAHCDVDVNSVRFVVDNTYKRIPWNDAKLDKSGTYRKVHEWTLYVDVVSGDPDCVERVLFDLGPTFSPSTYICASPIKVTQSNGLTAWRFATTQQVYGQTNAKISIRGCGGSVKTVSHQIHLKEEAHRSRTLHTFHEYRPHQALRMIKIDDSQRYGIELELSSPPNIDTHAIADMMPRNAGLILIAGSYRDGRQSYEEGWKIVSDGSIVCNVNMPSCHKFELVSRILVGGSGLNEISAVTKALVNAQIQVNRSMGFHVHVDVSGFTLEQLIKICQNFIKYEEVMDSFMPPSRRTGSPECNSYFQSNRASVHGQTNKQRHVVLANCCNIETLAEMMNKHGRYHKLNLDNLKTRRQPTLEFRQHSATLDYQKISAWVRFCILFVRTSARLKSPTPFKEDRNLTFQFNALFQFVVKDRALRDFYQKRQHQVNAYCCTGCAHGGVCGEESVEHVTFLH